MEPKQQYKLIGIIYWNYNFLMQTENCIQRGMYYELKNSKEKYGHHLTDEEIRGMIVSLIGAGI